MLGGNHVRCRPPLEAGVGRVALRLGRAHRDDVLRCEEGVAEGDDVEDPAAAGEAVADGLEDLGAVEG